MFTAKVEVRAALAVSVFFISKEQKLSQNLPVKSCLHFIVQNSVTSLFLANKVRIDLNISPC